MKSLVFHYHGLSTDELVLLKTFAKEINSEKDVIWANEFIAEDYTNSFERCNNFFTPILLEESEVFRLKQLQEVWDENHDKGFITEMESKAIFKIAENLKVETKFKEIVLTKDSSSL